MNFKNFLESGHIYGEGELSLKFRIRLLNVIMLIIVTVAMLFSLAHYAGITQLTNLYATVNLSYSFLNFIFIFRLCAH